MPNVPTKPPTEPEPFSLKTDQRAVEHHGSSAAGGSVAAGVFVFQAQAEGGGGRVTRSRKKAAAGGPTEFKPFALATDVRG